MSAGYGGLIGAYRFAFRRSGSAIFRSYVLVSVLVGGYIAVLLGLGLISWLAQPAGPIGQRSFLGVIALLILIPLTAPVLIVAHRHRAERGRFGDDRAFGLVGFAYVGSLYLGLVISDPSRHDGAGLAGEFLGVLDRLPDTYGLFPPVLIALTLLLLIRATGSSTQ